MDTLPKDIKIHITHFLDNRALNNMNQVSKEWKNIIKDDKQREQIINSNVRAQSLFAQRAPYRYGIGAVGIGILLGVFLAMKTVGYLAREYGVRDIRDTHALKGIGLGVIVLTVIICGVLGGAFGYSKKRNIENKIKQLQQHQKKMI